MHLILNLKLNKETKKLINKNMSKFKKYFKRKSSVVITSILVLAVLVLVVQYARAAVAWTANPNGVALSNSNAGIATNITLKFRLGTVLADTTDYLEIDLTDFTVDNTAAETESNYAFTGTNVFMNGNDFVATESSGIVTITLTDASNQLPASRIESSIFLP